MKVVPLKTFGQRLRDALKEANLSQAELARRFKITPQAVNQWVKAKNPPELSLDRWVALAYLLNINLEWLCTGVGNRGRADMDPVIFELLRKIQMLSPDHRQIIVTSVDVFLTTQPASFAGGNRR